MKLYELYELVGENTHIDLISVESGEAIAKYSEKDSIDEEYNEKAIVSFEPNWDKRVLEVVVE